MIVLPITVLTILRYKLHRFLLSSESETFSIVHFDLNITFLQNVVVYFSRNSVLGFGFACATFSIQYCDAWHKQSSSLY